MPKNKHFSQVRIIGGKWRSRKIKFPSTTGLRPTPDRIRETLFNWLSPYIIKADCLDCFAGSGALGFEALSRGANFCVLIDETLEVINNLQNVADQFHISNIQILHGHFPEVLINTARQFDIVFLDPPFRKNLIKSSSQWLENNNILTKQCLIYIEAEAELNPLIIPKNWQILRSKIAGQVGYHLARRTIE